MVRTLPRALAAREGAPGAGHRGKGRGQVLRGLVGKARMGPDGRKDIAIGFAQDHRHRAARRQAGRESPVRAYAEFTRHAPCNPRQDRRLARVAALIARAEPVPARLRVLAARLAGIDHHQPVRFGQRVHPGADGEVFGRLGAAVKHQHDPLDPIRSGRRRVCAIGAAACRACELVRAELGPIGDMHRRRACQRRLQAGQQAIHCRQAGRGAWVLSCAGGCQPVLRQRAPDQVIGRGQGAWARVTRSPDALRRR